MREMMENLLEKNKELDRLYDDWSVSTGEAREAYQKVIEDKCWRISRMVGVFYHGVIGALNQLEEQLRRTPPSNTPAAVKPNEPSPT